MGPVLEQPTLPPQKRVQVVPVETAKPAPQHEQVAARHDVDGIELQDPQPAQHLPHPIDARGRRRPGQVLAPDGQPPRLPQAQHEVIRHGPILQDPGTERAAVPPLRRQQRHVAMKCTIRYRTLHGTG